MNTNYVEIRKKIEDSGRHYSSLCALAEKYGKLVGDATDRFKELLAVSDDNAMTEEENEEVAEILADFYINKIKTEMYMHYSEAAFQGILDLSRQAVSPTRSQ